MSRSSFGAGFGGAVGAGCGCLILVVVLFAFWVGGCIALIDNAPTSSSPAPRPASPPATKDVTSTTEPTNKDKALEPEPTHDEKEAPPRDEQPVPLKQNNQCEKGIEKKDNKAPSDQKVDRINLTNYYRVEHGMTYEEVRAILGPASEELASGSFGEGTQFAVKTVMLTWKGSWGANAIITFQNGRVVVKAQYGLSVGEKTPDYVDQETIEKQRREREARAKIEKKFQAKQEAEQKRQEAVEAAMWRTWTDSTGNHEVEARFCGMTNGVVTLKKRDGTIKKVPLEKLSEEDRKWIEERAKHR